MDLPPPALIEVVTYNIRYDGEAIHILMGDFNALPESAPLTALVEAGWTQVDQASGAEIDGSTGTVAGRFIFEDNPHRIDHVLFRGPLRPVRRVTHLDEVEGRLASDHLPVRVVFEVR